MKQVDCYAAGGNNSTQISISTSDLIHFCGNWIWRAVEALVKSKEFRQDPIWIADRLNISVESAKDALEGLKRIGLVHATEKGIVANADFTNFDNADVDRSDRFEIHNKIKDQISNRITSRDSYCNIIMLSSQEDVAEFYDRFCSLVTELMGRPTASAQDVYAMELSLAKLTRESK